MYKKRNHEERVECGGSWKKKRRVEVSFSFVVFSVVVIPAVPYTLSTLVLDDFQHSVFG